MLELHQDVPPQDTFDVSLMNTHKETTICSIHAKLSFIVPPEVLVPGELGEPRQLGEIGLVHPRDELPRRYNIMGAGQLVKTWEGNYIPVWLLNPTNQPIKIFRRTPLGEFTPMDPTIATYFTRIRYGS